MTNLVHTIIWSVIQRYIPSLLHIVATLIITRLISPSDFGEVALVTTFIQIAQLLVQSGLFDGLIYHSKNSDELYSSVFYFNIFIAVLIYLLFFISGPFISDFYGISRLDLMIKVVSLNLLFFSLSITSRCILILAMRFKELATISLVASIIGSVLGLVLAYNGFNVWAIISIPLSINIIETILIFYKTRWVPKLVFDKQQLMVIVPYSLKIFLNNILQVVYDNIYSLTIGKVFNAKTLGLFNRMQTVMYYTTTNFMYSVESVFFPFLCNKRDESKNVNDAYEKILRLSVCILFPVVFIMFALAKPIIILILTEKWIEAVPILKYLCVAYSFIPLIYVNNSFLKLNNLAGVLFTSNFIKKVVGVSLLLVFLPFGIDWVCKGLIIYYFIDCLISMICIQKYIRINLFNQFRYICVVLCYNFVAFLLLSQFDQYVNNIWISIFLGSSLYLIFYTCFLILFKTKEWQIISGIIKKK